MRRGSDLHFLGKLRKLLGLMLGNQRIGELVQVTVHDGAAILYSVRLMR